MPAYGLRFGSSHPCGSAGWRTTWCTTVRRSTSTSYFDPYDASQVGVTTALADRVRRGYVPDFIPTFVGLMFRVSFIHLRGWGGALDQSILIFTSTCGFILSIETSALIRLVPLRSKPLLNLTYLLVTLRLVYAAYSNPLIYWVMGPALLRRA